MRTQALDGPNYVYYPKFNSSRECVGVELEHVRLLRVDRDARNLQQQIISEKSTAETTVVERRSTYNPVKKATKAMGGFIVSARLERLEFDLRVLENQRILEEQASYEVNDPMIYLGVINEAEAILGIHQTTELRSCFRTEGTE